MSSTFKSRDIQLAWQIHHQINLDVTGITENAAFPERGLKENYKPKTLIDNTLEIIDPTPNIHTLFVQFDKRFFASKLLSVEVKWSPRMTSCAGTCSFNTGNRYCVIALSSPLLKLRPRKDLVETLLHEMIHAYLFVTNNNRDRDGHGPEFCKHMHRINKEAGTNITIYHTFHAEVKLYQQHWWRCNGPCQRKHPFFGMVRRAMNRAPGPNDFWWKEHQLTCGGQFIKVREPEKARTAKGKKTKNDMKKPGLDKWLNPSPDNKPKGKSGSNDLYKPKDKPRSGTNNSNRSGSNKPFKSGGLGLKTKGGSSVITVNKWSASRSSIEPGFKKIGNSSNNVHGFGTRGPGSSGSPSLKPSTSSGMHFAVSGTVGGSSSGQSRLLQMFGTTKQDPQSQPKRTSQGFGPSVQCPICKDMILEKVANEHIDACLTHGEKNKKTSFVSSSPRFPPGENNKEKLPIEMDAVKCPVCNEPFPTQLIIEHIDLCLTLCDETKKSSAAEEFNSPSISVQPEATSSPSLIPIEKTPLTPIVIHDSDSEVDTPTRKRKSNEFFTFKESKIPKCDNKIANCPVCAKEIKIDDMNRHLDDCLTAIGDEMDKIEAGPSTKRDRNEKGDQDGKGNQNGEGNQNGKEDQESKPETCLICNEILDPEIPLTQHLDDCLRNMFNDDSDSSFEMRPGESTDTNPPKSNIVSPTKLVHMFETDQSQEEEGDLGKSEVSSDPNSRFPCPICMSLIPKNDMNNHLDICLG